MIAKAKTTLVAALVLSSASAAYAVDVTANADRDRGLTTYPQQTAPVAQPRGQLLLEGRNVGVQAPNAIPSDQQHWYERAPIDFNS